MTVTVSGFNELARELSRFNPDRHLTKGITTTAQRMAARARANMAGLPIPQSGRAGAGITPTTTGLTLEGSNPIVRAAAFGTTVHWVFGRPMLASDMTRRVFQPWLGGDPDPEQLYGVGPALTEVADGFGLETIADSYLTALKPAFPH